MVSWFDHIHCVVTEKVPAWYRSLKMADKNGTFSLTPQTDHPLSQPYLGGMQPPDLKPSVLARVRRYVGERLVDFYIQK